MSEEEVKSVNNQEAATPETDLEEQKPDQVAQETVKTESKEGSKEYNFSRLRTKNEELEHQIKELRDEMNRKSSPPPQDEVDELAALAEDDIITVAQAKKLSKKQAKEIIEQVIQEREKAQLPRQTRSLFSDYDAIMTEENIKKLEKDEPGLAAACAKAPNPWEATYKILKKFILPSEIKKVNKGEEKIKENLSKPASSNSIGRRGPLSNTNLWSESSKEELYKEMMEASRRG